MDDSPDLPLKRCTQCENEYPPTPEFFYLHKGKLMSQCKLCWKAKCKVYQDAHKEQHAEYERQYYLEHLEEYQVRDQAYRMGNPGATKVRAHRYRVKHSEELLERERQDRMLNPERHREKTRRWRKANPGKVRAHKLN